MTPEASGADEAENEAEDPVERLGRYIDTLPDILEAFETKHPNWPEGMLLMLLEWGLLRLRDCIEDKTDPEISWEHPFVELQFHVDCETVGDPLKEGTFSLNTGKLTISDVRDDETASKALSELMVRHLEIITLADLTQGMAMIQSDEGFIPFFPAEHIDEIRAIEDGVARDRAIIKALRPLSFGAGTIEYDDLKPEDDEPVAVSEDVLQQLESIQAPLVVLPIEPVAERLRLITIFEIHPFVFIPEKSAGYFPIVVGLAAQALGQEAVSLEFFEDPWADLARWPEDYRQGIWDRLQSKLADELASVGMGHQETEMVMVSLEAAISIHVPKERIAEIISKFTEDAQTLDANANISISIRAAAMAEEHRIGWRQLVDRVDASTSAADKGVALEELAAALFASVDGFGISSNVRTQTEEIDLWIENNVEKPPLAREGTEILVECKNWSGKVGKNELVVFRDKMRNRGGRCTLGFLLSWNGFADTVTKELLRGSTESLVVVLLDATAIRLAVESGDFMSVILAERRRALSI
ncbi:restriction endonuclease [Luteolibacter ambystomatis]|uniref:Restriction endonuclease n=1 Tax=Luteolibacter ambystomatis TaxID=2824561 RepID=A0A975J1E9_9BACT|nr:restriction endonuclease [Luteolibacter ambystomatis]QUE52217.1 restriction endonuclease [Luteolibacter ambystomatis]